MSPVLVRVPADRVQQAIYLIRGQNVMLDRDLAALYGVPTKALKQAVRRNLERFPDDFMFVLDTVEFRIWRSQFVPQRRSERTSVSTDGFYRAGCGNAIERLEESSRGPGQYRDHAHICSASRDARRQRTTRAEAGGIGEEVRSPV